LFVGSISDKEKKFLTLTPDAVGLSPEPAEHHTIMEIIFSAAFVLVVQVPVKHVEVFSLVTTLLSSSVQH
jgi:hypothetical protein